MRAQMPPYPIENKVKHGGGQAPSLGIPLTWVIGSEEDFPVGEQIFMTMSELYPSRGLPPIKYDL